MKPGRPTVVADTLDRVKISVLTVVAVVLAATIASGLLVRAVAHPEEGTHTAALPVQSVQPYPNGSQILDYHVLHAIYLNPENNFGCDTPAEWQRTFGDLAPAWVARESVSDGLEDTSGGRTAHGTLVAECAPTAYVALTELTPSEQRDFLSTIDQPGRPVELSPQWLAYAQRHAK